MAVTRDGAVSEPEGIQRVVIKTRWGNTLEVFYNPESNLLVVDLVAGGQHGGNELVRQTLNERALLAHVKR